MNEQIKRINDVFKQAVEELTQVKDEVIASLVSVDEPKYKTEKRAAKVGERILITDPLPRNKEYKGLIFTVKAVCKHPSGRVDVEEIESNIVFWRFRISEYEVIIEPEQVPKELTPNQQRAELIEDAKRFVSSRVNYSKAYYPRFKCHYPILFVVNEEKRTVVALTKTTPYAIGIFSRGIAKCMPDEVFNADIGKAIALARALEIDVPDEFLNAVQSTDAVKGMKVYSLNSMSKKRCSELEVVVDIVDGKYPRYKRGHWASVFEIIDDTNAEYSYDN